MRASQSRATFCAETDSVLCRVDVGRNEVRGDAVTLIEDKLT